MRFVSICAGLCAFMLCVSGCLFGSKPEQHVLRTPKRYHSIVVMPVSRGDDAFRQTMYHVLLDRMKAKLAVDVVGGDDVVQFLREDVGIDSEVPLEVLDFGVQKEGKERRKMLEGRFSSDIMMFTSVFLENKKASSHTLYVYVQMVDVRTGAVVFTISNQGTVQSEQLERSVIPLADSLLRDISQFLQF